MDDAVAALPLRAGPDGRRAVAGVPMVGLCAGIWPRPAVGATCWDGPAGWPNAAVSGRGAPVRRGPVFGRDFCAMFNPDDDEATGARFFLVYQRAVPRGAQGTVVYCPRLPLAAPVAQRTRASVFGTVGRGFDSLLGRHFYHRRSYSSVVIIGPSPVASAPICVRIGFDSSFLPVIMRSKRFAASAPKPGTACV